MNRHTDAGDASVKLLCATFNLSRAAYYAEARRQRGDDDGKVVKLPRPGEITIYEVGPRSNRAALPGSMSCMVR